MVKDIMALPDIEQRDLSSVRLVINGGEKMPIPLIERIQRTFPVGVVRRRVRPHRDGVGRHLPRQDSIVTKLGSVGRPCLYLELDIWDERRRRRCRRASAARSSCAAPRSSRGTGGDPDATDATFAGGWFHTGDIGVRDDDGYLFIVDRLKDMILSGGENIAGSEVERVLYEHDAVLEVAVVGRPDDRWGEVPVAFVVLKADATRDRGRARRALPRAARALQGPQGDLLPRRAAAEPLRQGAQARAPRRILTRIRRG